MASGVVQSHAVPPRARRADGVRSDAPRRWRFASAFRVYFTQFTLI
jgi:hypothetical protein